MKDATNEKANVVKDNKVIDIVDEYVIEVMDSEKEVDEKSVSFDKGLKD